MISKLTRRKFVAQVAQSLVLMPGLTKIGVLVVGAAQSSWFLKNRKPGLSLATGPYASTDSVGAMKTRAFKISIPDEQIRDLQLRLEQTRFPGAIDVNGWEDGASLSFMERLVHYWRHQFDWRAQEKRLNLLPQYLANAGGLDIHFIHQRGKGPSPLPLVLTHGWPGSFVEMERIIPLLTDPAAHGGAPADAFDIVVPSLPGFGFSQAPKQPGVSARRVAELWLELMNGLGYSKFAAQGGDIGAGFPRG